VRSKIIALEKAWNQAYKAADIRALDSILDNEIVLINDDGSVQSKAEFLGSIKATANNSQEQQVSPESMSVHVFGNTAISTGVFRAKGVERGKSYVRRERFVDTWLYKDNVGASARAVERRSTVSSGNGHCKRGRVARVHINPQQPTSAFSLHRDLQWLPETGAWPFPTAPSRKPARSWPDRNRARARSSLREIQPRPARSYACPCQN
jgi:ketosteroid isomerase-like protein